MYWPIARRGVLAGVTLGMARALGEFGATLMVLGWQPDRQTLSIAIYGHFERGNLSAAFVPAGLLAVAGAALMLLYNRLSRVAV